MKKTISTLMLLAVAAAAFVSCQKAETAPQSEPSYITFTSANPDTKTEWNGSTIVWSAGDLIRVACQTGTDQWYEAGSGDNIEPKLYVSEQLAKGGESAQFKLKAGNNNFPTDLSGTLQFYAIYPSTCNGNSASFKNAPVLTYEIKSQQASTSQSFDKSCDIMWAKAISTYSAISAIPEPGVSLMWNRVVAHAHITLKNINGIAVGENVRSVTLTTQDDAALVGKYDLNIINGDIQPNKTSNSLTIELSDVVADASGNVTFWACINPCAVTNLQIVVDTDVATYTCSKSDLQLNFEQNRHNVLPVDMSNALCEPKGGTSVIYTFTSKAWDDTTKSWTSTKDGAQLTSGRGVKVDTKTSGASAECSVDFDSVSKVVVTYSTNASDGVGAIDIGIGQTKLSKEVTKVGGTDDRTLEYDFSALPSGKPSISVKCTTNAIYIKSIEIISAN